MSIYDDIVTDSACSNGDSVRYNSKENTTGARDMLLTIWDDYIKINGVKMSYRVHGFNVNRQDNVLYAEDATAPFADGVDLIAFPEFSNDGMLLAKFGIESTADMSLLISIPEYTRKFGDPENPTVVPHPKSGDVIEMVEMGWDVTELPPNPDFTYTDPETGDIVELDAKTLLCKYGIPEGQTQNPAEIILNLEDYYGYKYVRYPRMYEITEVRYQDLSMAGVNFMQGHYVWLLEAKRFEYSFEPNINPTGTVVQPEVADDNFFGSILGDQVVSGNERTYNPSLDQVSKEKIWDYDANEKTNDSIYGGYGYND
jgi:hypothetical protein